MYNICNKEQEGMAISKKNKIARYEYFIDNFEHIVDNFDYLDLTKEYWELIEEDFGNSITYQRLFDKENFIKICSKNQQEQLLKEQLPEQELIDSYLRYLQIRGSYNLLLIAGAIYFAGVEGSDIQNIAMDHTELLTWIDVLDPTAIEDRAHVYYEDFCSRTDTELKAIIDYSGDVYNKRLVNLYEKCLINGCKTASMRYNLSSLQKLQEKYTQLIDFDISIFTDKEDDKKGGTVINVITSKPNKDGVNDDKQLEMPKLLSIDEAISKNFEGLFGFENVKQHLHDLSNAILKYPNFPFHLNYCFTGNPGVGKTTLTKAIANTYFDCGVLKNNNLTVINATELKGKYVGHTAPKVKDIFARVHGGALLLDEAYVLAGDGHGEDSFAQEAITQLMKEIDYLWDKQEKNPTDRTMLAIAGYKEPIERFLNINPGMEGRLNKFQFQLDDYSSDQLFAFFEKKFSDLGVEFKEPKSIRDAFDKYMSLQKQRKNFANVRTVKNLFESSLLNQAGRKDSGNVLIADDVAKSLEVAPKQTKKVMGFSDKDL